MGKGFVKETKMVKNDLHPVGGPDYLQADGAEVSYPVRMPAGVINVLDGFLCRYSEFAACLQRLQRPQSDILRLKGVGATYNLNHGVDYMLAGGKEWLWMLDDACIFTDDLLLKLLKRDVDIVIPLSLNDEFPHLPELYDKDYTLIDKYWLAKQEGLVETEKLATYRGMLVKREVFEVIEGRWFRNEGLMPDRLGGDIWFCQEAIKNGFKIHVDFENVMGRIAHFSMWAGNNDGEYMPSILRPMPWEVE